MTAPTNDPDWAADAARYRPLTPREVQAIGEPPVRPDMDAGLVEPALHWLETTMTPDDRLPVGAALVVVGVVFSVFYFGSVAIVAFGQWIGWW